MSVVFNLVMLQYDVAIIGGGILGANISHWISSLYDLDLCVIEKESDVALHASSRNTGVLHSPFYLDPKTKKILSKSSLISYDMWKELANKKNVPWNKTGVLELALDDQQHKSLEEYLQWGDANGIPAEDLDLLDGKEVLKLEPNIQCNSALFCKREVSSDFGMFTKIIKQESEKQGTTFLFKKNVQSITKTKKNLSIIFDDGTNISAKFVINCAGGNSLDVAQMLGLATEYSDLHFRGEYWISDPPIS